MSDTADDNERLRLLLQRELEKTREDMTRMAASAAETDGWSQSRTQFPITCSTAHRCWAVSWPRAAAATS